MTSGTLFLSLWDISLENLPEGTFTRRRISQDEARSCIDDARREKRLVCVAEKDFLAPYHKHELDNQEAFCRVLTEHCGIGLSLRDFAGSFDDDGRESYAITPLVCVQVKADDRLLVATSHFAMKESATLGDRFEIDPETVEFHLFEAAQPAARKAGMPAEELDSVA